MSWGKLGRYRPHHYFIYELTPGYVSSDGLTHHNAYGFRGPEFRVEKDPATFRIVCMGESTTYSEGIRDDAKTYPARLGEFLQRERPDRRIEVLNAGVGGFTSAENLLYFIFRVQPLRPDLVIFYNSHNDVHPRRWPTLSRDYSEYRKAWGQPGVHRSWIRWFAAQILRRQQTLMDRVTKARQHASNIDYENLARNPSDHFRANMLSLAFLAKGWGIGLLLVNPFYPNLEGEGATMRPTSAPARGVYEHRRVVEEIGAELDIPVYDLRPDMPPPPEWTTSTDPYYSDEVHVTEQGAELMAAAVGRAVIERRLFDRGSRVPTGVEAV